VTAAIRFEETGRRGPLKHDEFLKRHDVTCPAASSPFCGK
jgi:hypothetical protein